MEESYLQPKRHQSIGQLVSRELQRLLQQRSTAGILRVRGNFQPEPRKLARQSLVGPEWVLAGEERCLQWYLDQRKTGERICLGQHKQSRCVDPSKSIRR